MQTLLRANLLTAQVASGGPGRRPARRLGRRGADPLPRRHRGRRDVRRRDGRRLRRARVHRRRRLPARRRGPARRARAAAAAGRRRARDPRARLADQGVPGRRPRGDGGGHRPRRRRDGGGDDGQGQRRVRPDARPPARPRRPPPPRRPCATGARRGRAGVQPGRRRRRARPRAARQRRRHSPPGTFDVGTLALFVAYLGWLSFLPRMVGRVLARTQAGGRRLRPHAPAGRRRGRRQHRAAAGAAARAAPAGRPAGRPPARAGAAAAPRRARPDGAVPGRRRRARRHLPGRPRSVRRRHRSRRARARARCCARCSGWPGRPTSVGEVRWNGELARRPRRLPRAAERGVPAAGPAARVGLGARQRRPRAGARRRRWPGRWRSPPSTTTSPACPTPRTR